MAVKIRSNIQHDPREGDVKVEIDEKNVDGVFKAQDGFDLEIDGSRIVQCPYNPQECKLKRSSIVGFGPACSGVEGVTFNFPKKQQKVLGGLWCKERGY